MTSGVVSWKTKNIAVSSKPSHQAFSFSRSGITCIAHRVIISWFAITRWTIPALIAQLVPNCITGVTWSWIIGCLAIDIALIFTEPIPQTNFLPLWIASETCQRVIPKQTVDFATRAIPAVQTDLSSCTRLACVVPMCGIIMGDTVHLTAGAMPSSSTNPFTRRFIASIVSCNIGVFR